MHIESVCLCQPPLAPSLLHGHRHRPQPRHLSFWTLGTCPPPAPHRQPEGGRVARSSSPADSAKPVSLVHCVVLLGGKLCCGMLLVYSNSSITLTRPLLILLTILTFIYVLRHIYSCHTVICLYPVLDQYFTLASCHEHCVIGNVCVCLWLGSQADLTCWKYCRSRDCHKKLRPFIWS